MTQQNNNNSCFRFILLKNNLFLRPQLLCFCSIVNTNHCWSQWWFYRTMHFLNRYFFLSSTVNNPTWSAREVLTGPKLDNAPPEIIFRGHLKIFSWMVMQNNEPWRGDAKLGDLGACPSQKILRNLTLFWRLFVRFEPLKFLSFNKV